MADRRMYFLDYHDKAMRLLQEAGFFCAVPLHVGSLPSCLDFNIYFPSTIPARLGFKQDVKGENLAEGVVIRSCCEIAIDDGDVKRGSRAMFKRKIASFSEKKYDALPKPKHESSSSSSSSSSDHHHTQLAYLNDVASALVNDERVASAVSKIGSLDRNASVEERKTYAKSLLRLVVEDVIEDIRENFCEGGIDDSHDESLRHSIAEYSKIFIIKRLK